MILSDTGRTAPAFGGLLATEGAKSFSVRFAIPLFEYNLAVIMYATLVSVNSPGLRIALPRLNKKLKNFLVSTVNRAPADRYMHPGVTGKQNPISPSVHWIEVILLCRTRSLHLVSRLFDRFGINE